MYLNTAKKFLDLFILFEAFTVFTIFKICTLSDTI